MIEIKKPAEKTWYIINCEIPIMGVVETDQLFTSGAGTIEDLETFIIEELWLARLLELEIEPPS